MQSAFDIKTGEWKISWPGRVAKYDLVYQSPPEDPMQGIALGNGDVGALFWTQGSKLIIAVNKCDLWDDLGKDRFHNWATLPGLHFAAISSHQSPFQCCSPFYNLL